MCATHRQENSILWCIFCVCLLNIVQLYGDVPGLIGYQGRISVNGTNYNETGSFGFALVDDAGEKLWSNDGNLPPVNTIPLVVSHGRFSVMLGDGTVTNMALISSALFEEDEIRLRVWFDDGANGLQQLQPDRRLTAAAYAMIADTVTDGSVTGDKIADNAVNYRQIARDAVDNSHVLDNSLIAADLAPDSVGASELADNAVSSANVINNSLTSNDLAANSVTASEIATDAVGPLEVAENAIDSDEIVDGSISSVDLSNSINLGDSSIYGSLGLFYCANSPTKPSIYLNGAGPLIQLRNDDAKTVVSLAETDGYGYLSLYNDEGGSRVKLLGDGPSGGGSVEVLDSNATGTINLEGAETADEGGLITISDADGSPGVKLDGDSTYGGKIDVCDTSGTVLVDISTDTDGGQIKLKNASGLNRIELDGDYLGNSSGYIGVGSADGSLGVRIDGGATATTGGKITLYEADGSTTLNLCAQENDNNGGQIEVCNDSGTVCVQIDGDHSVYNSGFIELYDSDGDRTLNLQATEDGTDGGQISLYNQDGAVRLQLDGDYGTTDGGQARLLNASGSTTISLYGDYNSTGDGRIVTDEIQITGGSDLSEQFNIHGDVEPGMLVCIDASHPGDLCVSHDPYAPTVAGVVSGAGGIKPGMLMGQTGTLADGVHPVALTGRVYVHATADNGAIQPGDLLTTASLRGHAMKATDASRTFGSVIGKAMTGLDKDTGLVLVLVQPR